MGPFPYRGPRAQAVGPVGSRKPVLSWFSSKRAEHAAAAQVAARTAFLQAAINAEEAMAAHLTGTSTRSQQVNPWGETLVDAGASATAPAGPPLKCAYPARPSYNDFASVIASAF